MGHSSSIALGISLFKPSRKVFALDGDGAMFMHMGSLP
jgi:phosphonopyruvate decarboxylase